MGSDAARDEMIWGYLMHLGYNMWCDREMPDSDKPYLTARPFLRFDENLWNDLIERWADAGVNMVVIDLGEGVQYESHPEISVKDSWATEHLQEELAKLRGKGLEPIPKLNFSTAHDAWLGEYSRCVSTERYYTVCREVIAEVIALFERPRFFHLGMDEETAEHQRNHAMAVMRQHELWWHDLNLLVEAVEEGGSRAWIWSDYVWRHPETFYKNMPHTVLQSNWYYGDVFNEEVDYVKAYLGLEKHGYDQVPTGSNWSHDDNFEKTVAYCGEHIASELLKGFLQAPWHPTVEDYRDHHLAATEQVKRARAAWENR